VGDLPAFRVLGFFLDAVAGSEIDSRSKLCAFVILRVFFGLKTWSVLIFTCAGSLRQVEMPTFIGIAALPSSAQVKWGGRLCPPGSRAAA